MPKTVTERADFRLTVEADASGARSVFVEVRPDTGAPETTPVDVIAASAAAVTILAGDSITLTAAQVRTVLRRFAQSARTQALATLGY